MRRSRRIVSALLLLHFGAIVIAVLAPGSPNRPSVLFIDLRELLTPYLSSLFLASPYRFYAPNPSRDQLLWVRIHRANGENEWVEWPTDYAKAKGSLAKRYGSMTRNGLRLAADPGQSGHLQLTRLGEAWIGSFVRHIGRTHHAKGAPIESVSVFRIQRGFLTPDRVRAGLDHDDMRLLQVVYLGDYQGDGGRLLPATSSVRSPAAVTPLATEVFLEEVLKYDAGLLDGNVRRLPSSVDAFLRGVRANAHQQPASEIRRRPKSSAVLGDHR